MVEKKKAPRRANGEGSITYKENKKLYYARITVGKDANGNPKRKSKYFKCTTDAKHWLTEQKALQLKGIDLSSGDVTFGALGKEFMETKKATISPNTYESYVYIYRHLDKLYDKKIKEVPLLIQKVINEKSETLSSSSIRKVWTIARQILEIAYDRDMIRKIPRVSMPKLVERIPNPLSVENMIDLINAAEKYHSRYSFGIWLEMGTGLRRSEMLALDWDDIDFTNNTITVQKALIRANGKTILNDHTKTKAGCRILPVPKIVMDKLKELPDHTGHLFKTETGTYLNPWNWSRLFRSWRKIAKLNDVRFHDLRHQFATMLMQVGTHARVAQSMTGQSDMPTLLERYTHVQPKLMRQAANKLNKALKPLQ